MSGNRYLQALALVLVALLLSGCDLFKRAQQTYPDRPPRTTQTKPDVDTSDVVIDLPSPDDVELDISLKELEDRRLRDRDLPAGPEGAVVSIMMPFFGSSYSATTGTLPQNSQWALQYYAGVKLGLEELERKGERTVVHVFDTRGDAGEAQRLLADPELRSSHAIIGPYIAAAAEAAATAAKAADLPFVVPFSASTSIASDFPRLVQLNPSLMAHLDAAAAYLADRYSPDQVVLVGLPTGAQNQQISYLQMRHRELAPTDAAWRTWQLNTSDVGLQGLAWNDKFAQGKETIFVLPVYQEPKVVLSFLSQLQIGRGRREATVFGMPQWASFNQLDPGILEDLHVRITAGLEVDASKNSTREFDDLYIARYGALPELPSYLGYDAIRYIVPLANRYGRAWVEHLPSSFPQGLASDYRVQPVYSGAGEGTQQRYQNNSVQVLTYRDYEFVRE